MHKICSFLSKRSQRAASNITRCLIAGLFVSVTFAVTVTADTQKLSATETLMVNAIDANYANAHALLEQAVNINSGSLNIAGVKQVGEVFMQEFSALGFNTRWEDGALWNRAGHLIAEHGNKGTHFLMIGHLDTVFEKDSPFQKYQRSSETSATGPGIVDMKGGDVIILEALRALESAGILDEITVTVVLIGDEESSGRPLEISRDLLTQAADRADVALAFENGDGNPATAVIARRGYTGWQLDVTGKPAHSSQVFTESVGYGSIYETARILSGFYQQMDAEQFLTFNPGVILGGTTVDYHPDKSRGNSFGKANVVAETTVVSGDLRTISMEQLESAQQRMHAIVQDNLPGTSATIHFTEGYPPLAPTKGNRELLGLYNTISLDLGQGEVKAVDPARAGAADVSFTAGLVEMALDGMGMMGTGAHTVKEAADLPQLQSQAKRAALLMYRLRDRYGDAD